MKITLNLYGHSEAVRLELNMDETDSVLRHHRENQRLAKEDAELYKNYYQDIFVDGKLPDEPTPEEDQMFVRLKEMNEFGRASLSDEFRDLAYKLRDSMVERELGRLPKQSQSLSQFAAKFFNIDAG